MGDETDIEDMARTKPFPVSLDSESDLESSASSEVGIWASAVEGSTAAVRMERDDLGEG
jgi:hypothetical protein